MRESNTAERLKLLMEERNIKQVDILNMVKPYCEEYGEKINKSHLSQWISGRNEPNNRKLFILSKALGVDETWLMGYSPKDKIKIVPEYSSDQLDLIEMYSKLTEKQKQQVLALLHSFTD